MTITLDLPNELERELEQAAARVGLPVEEYAVRVLETSHRTVQQVTPWRTGAELLAIWEREGLLGGGPEIEDPVKFARELRERNQNRRHD